MVKLLIIADDFTGALDTGIQFVNRGIATQVFTGKPERPAEIAAQTEVLVVDSETRPMTPESAYETVKEITAWAKSLNIEIIFKKTDSALRGNIGSELQAVSDGNKEKTLYFLPGYPKMDRLTINGFHYIKETLLEHSVFGQDPFEPVTQSYIPDIIRQESQMSLQCIGGDEPLSRISSNPSAVICDIRHQEDMEARVEELLERGQLKLIAGCAALADSLASKIPFHRNAPNQCRQTKGLFVACGSLNRITEQQLIYAQKNGFTRQHLTIEQKLQKGYYDTSAGKAFLQYILETCRKHPQMIVDSMGGEEAMEAYRKKYGISMPDVRRLIPEAHGQIADFLARNHMDITVLTTGGDTLMGYMKLIGCTQIRPVCEIEPGVVVSELENRGFLQQVISKSGGFGTEDVLVRIAEKITNFNK